MSKLKFAVVGLGLGRVWAKLIKESPEFELAGLVDIDPARLIEFGDQFGVPATARFTDFSHALKNLEVDAIVVVTLPKDHKDMILSALDAGYHVLSEKPLAATIQEARDLAREIPKARTKFMVSQNYRWTDGVETVHRAIANGTIGELGYVNVEFHLAIKFGGWRDELPEPLFQDMSIHHFDELRWMTGRNCVRMYARSFRPYWSWFKGNSVAEAIIQMEGGIEVTYFASWVARGRPTPWHAQWRFAGEKGAIHWDGASDVTAIIGGQEDASREPRQVSTPIELRKLERNGFAYSLYEFASAIEQNRTPITGIEDNIQSFAMIMAALDSCRTGQPVDVQEYIKHD